MPYKDPEKQKEAVERYQAEHSDEVKRKKAEWYQKNKAKRAEQKRELRRTRHAQDASALLSGLMTDLTNETDEPSTD